jgi:hypothetical protein
MTDTVMVLRQLPEALTRWTLSPPGPRRNIRSSARLRAEKYRCAWLIVQARSQELASPNDLHEVDPR